MSDYVSPVTGEPLEDPYARGYWSPETGEVEPDEDDAEWADWLDGRQMREREDAATEQEATP